MALDDSVATTLLLVAGRNRCVDRPRRHELRVVDLSTGSFAIIIDGIERGPRTGWGPESRRRIMDLETTLCIEYADRFDHPDAISSLVRGQREMVRVRGLLSRSEAERLVGALGDAATAGRRVHPETSPDAAVRLHGAMIAPTQFEPEGPDIDEYRRSCAELEATLADAGLATLRCRIPECLGALAGVEAGIPEGYGLASVRVMPPGTGAPLHRDAYPQAPLYDVLRARCDLAVQFSWYVQLVVPEAGGRLVVYPDLDCDLDHEAEAATIEASTRSYESEVGDLLLHPAGARWHRVTPVEGSRARQTFGGCCAFTRDHERIWTWA